MSSVDWKTLAWRYGGRVCELCFWLSASVLIFLVYIFELILWSNDLVVEKLRNRIRRAFKCCSSLSTRIDRWCLMANQSGRLYLGETSHQFTTVPFLHLFHFNQRVIFYTYAIADVSERKKKRKVIMQFTSKILIHCPCYMSPYIWRGLNRN